MNRTVIFIIFTLLLILVGGYLLLSIQEENPGALTSNTVVRPTQSTEKNCLADECLLNDVTYPVSKLPEAVKKSLTLGLRDEYKAYATYKSVIDSFGNVRPFIMISRAEQQHIASLQGLYEKYGLDIPENNMLNTIQAPNSLEEACAIGVQGEIDNIKLYKESLLPAVKNYEDITIVFTNLMNASEEKHLPAFTRCD